MKRFSATCSSKSLTLTAVLGTLIVAGCNTNVPNPAGSGFSKPTLNVNKQLPAATTVLPPFADGVPRPVAVLTDSSNIPVEFVENEMMVETADAAALAAIVARWNATILDTFDYSQFGMEGGTLYLLRVNAAAADQSQLAADLSALSPNTASQIRVSSDAGAGLIAAAARESVRGATIGLNIVMQGHGLRDRNVREAGTGGMLTSRDRLRTENYTPDPFQWSYMRVGGPQNFGVAEAWSVLDRAGKLNNKVKIAVVDGGFADSTEYPPERTNYTATINALDPTEQNQNECTGGSSCPWHGLNVVEACMGRVDNNLGGAGPAGPVARCVTIRRSADIFNNIQAIGTAVFSGANIINMSFGSRLPATLSWVAGPFSLATGRARAAGKLIFASAGNDNSDIDSEDCFIACWEDSFYSPAENGGVISVGALDLQARFRRNDSNYGSGDLDIWGPGYMWVGPDPANMTTHSFGATSGASPFVAGVAALIWAANPSLDNNGVERILMETCNRGGPGEESRWPNALAAVVRALGDTPPDLQNVKVERVGFTGRNVQFSCTAADAEDGEAAVAWTSDVQGYLGSGTFMGRDDLRYGRHNITCTATDRHGVAVSQTVVFELPNSLPRVLIESPEPDSTYYAGQTIFFDSYTYDLETSAGLPDASLVWTSNRQGQIATGRAPTAILTAIGAHNVTLTGRDPEGATATSTIKVNVLAPPPDGIPPSVYIYPLDYDPYGGATEPGTGRWYQDTAFIASAIDPEDGVLPGSAIKWEFIPTSGGISWNIAPSNAVGTYLGCRIYGFGSFTIRATATDSNGKSSSYSRSGVIELIK